MKEETKSRIIYLINGLINCDFSENMETNITSELDNIIKDPNWSDYIFWSEDYLLPNGEIDYDKFFEKIQNHQKQV